jgi:NTE family protein
MAVTAGAGAAPRVGLVLGPGGVLGAAWMVGALRAVEEQLGRPVQDAQVIVGTSAGSVLAAAIRSGVGTQALLDHQRGTAIRALPGIAELERDSGRFPPIPRLRLGSPRLLAASAFAPHRFHPHIAASALVLEGRARHDALSRFLSLLVATAPPAWPGSQTWIVAVDYDAGRRVSFGREGGPTATLPDAVVASCSIPGWHQPKRIGDRRYVDGGVRSVASVDLLRRERLDHVYVLAPMASVESDRPTNPALRAERLVRQMLARSLFREVRRVEDAGTTVTVLMPGPVDLDAMGGNLMDARRRTLVLETSLHTAPARLAAASRLPLRAA